MRRGLGFSIIVLAVLCTPALAAPPTYTISGVVATAEGVGVEGVDVVPDGGVATTTTAADASYSITVPKRWTGTVTVSKTGWLITPASRNYPSVDINYTGQNYTAFQPKISGRVFDYDYTPLEGATLTADNGGGEDTTDAAGNYQIAVPYNWSGQVSAELAGYGFPLSNSYTNVTIDQVKQHLYGFQPTISGYVKEADGTPKYGVNILADNGGGVCTTNGSGYYEITVPYNWSGTTTISMTGLGWVFTPVSYAYSSVLSNVNEQNYTAENIGISVALDGSGDFTTIQAAVDVSFYDGNSDLIIVSDGIYTGNGNIRINIHDKDITVKSENGPDNCIIDCQTMTNAFDLYGAITIDGITMRNGSGDEGGAIQCLSGNLVINNCKFINNTARNGGAINKNSYRDPIVIKNCEFINNEAVNGSGGAIWLYSEEETIENCSFHGNTALYGGGAIRGVDGSILDCRFYENSAGLDGGGVSAGGPVIIKNCEFNSNRITLTSPIGNPHGGAGLRIGIPINAIVENCIFEDNDAVTNVGSGLFVEGYDDDQEKKLLISKCEFRRNTDEAIYIHHARDVAIDSTIVESTSGYGIYCNSSFIVFKNLLINRNDLAGIRLNNTSSAYQYSINNCTIADNGGTIGGVSWNDNTSLNMVNTIVWGNTDPQLSENTLSAVSQIVFCDIQGGYTGTGNINADPLFADASVGDYHLQPGSPCIDTGDNTAVTEPNDLDGLPRIIDGDCDGTPMVDMGAYEFDYLYLGDFEGNDCDVDLSDFAVMAQSWQQDDQAIDIAPYLAPDGVIDLEELLVILENWMLGTE